MFLFFLFHIKCKPVYEQSVDQKVVKVKGLNENIVRDDVIEICSLDNLEILIIHEGIIGIGPSSFQNAKKLKNITFPSSYFQSLGSYCFSGCSSLESVVLPEGLETISSYAFENTGLIEVTFPSTLRNIDAYLSFIGSNKLLRFRMPKTDIFSVSKDETILIYNKTIAYASVNGAKKITIPDEIEIISSSFASRHLITTIIFSSQKNLVEIRSGAFSAVNINRFEMPEGLKKCFSISSFTKYVYLPSSLEEIGSDILTPSMEIKIGENCAAVYKDENGMIMNGNRTKILVIPTSMDSLTIPKELETIDLNVIRSSWSIKSIIVEEGHPNYYSYKNGLYTKSEDTLIAYPRSGVTANFSANCTKIGTNCFMYSSIQHVYFEGNKVKTIGYASFKDCGLVSIEMPDSVENLEGYCFNENFHLLSIKFSPNIKSIPGSCLTQSKVKEILLDKCTKVTSINGNSFYNNANCSVLTLPPHLEFIYGSVFLGCSSLESIFIPSSVQTLEDECFANTASLKNVTFGDHSALKCLNFGVFRGSGILYLKVPDNVTTIEQGSLSKCSNLTEIEFGKNSHLQTIQKSSFIDCNSIKILKLPKSLTKLIPQSLSEMYGLQEINIDEENDIYKSINGIVFNKAGTVLYVFPSGKESCSITGNVLEVAESAFFRCKLLENISFAPDLPLKEIGANTFTGCSGLHSIDIPAATTKLYSSCFSDCSQLERVIFSTGSTLSQIGSGCFTNCTSLVQVSFGFNSSLEVIDDVAFEGCISLKQFEFPKSMRSIGDSAFLGCKLLEFIVFEANCVLSSIGINSFKDCTNLKEINFPSNLSSLGTDCFQNCKNLRKITYCGDNPITANAFPNNRGIIAYVTPYYPLSAPTFGGIPAVRILDRECNIPTNLFTGVGEIMHSPILTVPFIGDE